MKIKKYTEFMNETIAYKLGCVMVEVPVSNWKEITSSINQEDLYEVKGEKYGIQDNPHLTLLYGFNSEISKEQVQSILEEVTNGHKIEIDIEDIDIFENENFDVVKFNVKKTEQLQSLYDALNELPNENTFPDYRPHMTIAYVKKGLGKKYTKPYRHKITSNKICYSMSNGQKIYFDV